MHIFVPFPEVLVCFVRSNTIRGIPVKFANPQFIP